MVSVVPHPNAALGETPAAIHWDLVLETLKKADGMPQMVGLEIDPADLPPGAVPSPAPAPETVPPVTPAPGPPVQAPTVR